MVQFYRCISVVSFLLAMLFFYNASGQQQGINELELAMNQAVKGNDYRKATSYAFDIANHYWTNKESEKALDYLDKCISYSKKGDETQILFLAYQQQGIIYRAEKNYGKASDVYERSLKVARDLQNYTYLKESLVHVAESYMLAGRTKRAISPLEEALSLAIRENDLSLRQTCYQQLAQAYKALGNSVKANEYQALYNNLIEVKQSEFEKARQVAELEQKIENVGNEKKTANARLFENTQKLKQAEDSLLNIKYSLDETSLSLREAEEMNEKRKLEIDLLNKDKELAGMQIKEQQAKLVHEAWIRNSVLIGLLLASSLVIVVVVSYRRAVKANQKIEKQNENIKSSINYARRIQEAMLPKSAQQEELLPESFVLFRPRDAVSGDFYWMTEIKNWYNPDVVFAAADCTGHGVPGAFMSMIGINTLNGIIKRGIADTNQILEELDMEIRNTLQQEITGNTDGMDIALCIHRKEKNLLEFSGAKNPLYYVQNNELFHIKGDVRAIGGRKSKNEKPFKKHNVLIESTTVFYIFSDGYSDQFGENGQGKFMSKRLKELLLEIHHLPLEKQKEILSSTFDTWKGSGSQIDDVLVMGVKLEPEF